MRGDGYEDTPARIRAEVAASPGALWITRRRRVPDRAFDRLERRLRDGLEYGVAIRLEDALGRILLVRMDPRVAWTASWVTPGGGANPTEAPQAAIRREVWEETGGRVKGERLWKVFHETVTNSRGQAVRWDFLQYTGRWSGGVPRPRVPGEIAEARWFRRLPNAMAFRADWLRPPRQRSRRPDLADSRLPAARQKPEKDWPA